jgi:hypothetical protein
MRFFLFNRRERRERRGREEKGKAFITTGIIGEIQGFFMQMLCLYTIFFRGLLQTIGNWLMLPP